MPIYNLESYGYFLMGFCRSICHSFNFLNVRFKAEVMFFSIKFSKKIYFHVKFVNEFIFVSFFTLTYLYFPPTLI